MAATSRRTFGRRGRAAAAPAAGVYEKIKPATVGSWERGRTQRDSPFPHPPGCHRTSSRRRRGRAAEGEPIRAPVEQPEVTLAIRTGHNIAAAGPQAVPPLPAAATLCADRRPRPRLGTAPQTAGAFGQTPCRASSGPTGASIPLRGRKRERGAMATARPGDSELPAETARQCSPYVATTTGHRGRMRSTRTPIELTQA